MPGSAAYVQFRTPRRFTSITFSHCSGVVWEKNPNSSVPALFTRMSIGALALSTAACAEPRSVTSSSIASPEISPATSAAPSRLRSPIVTSAPSAARRRAIAAPMPLAPPVTSAFRPSSLIAGRSLLRGPCSLLAGGGSDPDHRRHRSTRLRPRRALGKCRAADRDRFPRGKPRRGGRRPRPYRNLGGRGRGPGERRGGGAWADRLPDGPLPGAVRDPDQPQGGALARPAARRLHGADRRGRERQGEQDPRRLAGI